MDAPKGEQSDLNHAAAHSFEHGLQPVVHVEGLQQSLGVGVGRFITDYKPLGDLAIAEATGEQVEHLIFPRR